MNKDIFESNIAIVGGGKFCKIFLEFILNSDFGGRRPTVLGVADENENAEGFQYAQSLGIFTTNDFIDFYHMEELEVILELTKDPSLAEVIRETRPEHIEVIDHFEVRGVWDDVQVEAVRAGSLKELRAKKGDPKAVFELFDRTFEQLTKILRRRNKRALEIELELFEKERTLYQIIQGSTIPTFVINKAHIVTHWNKAAENLTGYSAEQMVGTNKQWIPFYDKPRPTLADAILDQIKEKEITSFYDSRWRQSSLIEGAYEAEGFFPGLGENGKWCWFTAAPIKAPDGTIIGAIETLWDRTEEKRAQEERERHTRELTTLCSIYSALNTSADIEKGVEKAVEEVQSFLTADAVCIYLL
jgi:PAS domain-containing protein